MISQEMEFILNMILSKENAEEIIDHLLCEYAKQSVNNARSLLNKCLKLSDIALFQCNDKKEQYHEAANDIVLLRSIQDPLPSVKLALMLPVCKALYPDGKVNEKSSEAKKMFFKEFKETLNNHKAFSWEEDKEWADSYGYSDYIRLVQSQED